MASLRPTQLAAAASLVGGEVMVLSKLSATVTMTATTISAQASDNSFNDSGNGFLTAGFAVGDNVRVTGFTGNVANNIFSGVVTAATAGKLTIGGADGNVIVDDAAGESVTITKWESKRTDLDTLSALIRNPRVQSVASAATVTPTFSNDLVEVTALAVDLTIANPTGTAVNGQGLVIRINDNGTARALAFGSQFRAIDVTLPTTTVVDKWTYIAAVYNSGETKWDVVAVRTEA